MRYKAKNKGDEDKISQALQKIMQEDLTIKTVNDSANHQTLIYASVISSLMLLQAVF